MHDAFFFFFFNDTSTSCAFSNGATKVFAATFTRSASSSIWVNKLQRWIRAHAESQCENARRSLLLCCLDNIVLSPFNGSRAVCVPQGQLPIGGETLQSACLSCFSTRHSFRFSSISIDMCTVLCLTESFLPHCGTRLSAG